MIGYVTLGTNDLAKSTEYYDALFATIGATRVYEGNNFVAWGTSSEAPAISVIEPFDGNPATVGNGVMIAIPMLKAEQVDAFYAKAIELGGTDEGAPGPRDENFYVGYFRDLDGNKLNAFCVVDDPE